MVYQPIYQLQKFQKYSKNVISFFRNLYLNHVFSKISLKMKIIIIFTKKMKKYDDSQR